VTARTGLPCVLALVVAGCGGPSSYDDFRRQLTGRWCDRQIRCGQLGASESAHCAVPPLLATVAPPGFEVSPSVGRGGLQFRTSNAQDCLDHVKSASCDEARAALTFARFCHGILGALVAVGGKCLDSVECQGGICVAPAPGCAGVCVAYAATGTSCSQDSTAPQQSCDPTVHYCDGVCKRKLQPGDACASDDACAFDSVCVDGKCADPPRLGAGAVCGAMLPPCQDGLFCDSTGVCASQKPRGASCVDAGACQDGLVCFGGKCAPWLDIGSACTTSSPSGCPASESCIANSCAAVGNDRAGPDRACATDGDCADGLWCQGHFCAYRIGVGGPCASDNGCATGLRCDPMSRLCSSVSCPAAP
jgi:hypothetical protein